jgi:hypothetical protein
VGFSLYWVQHEKTVRIKRLNTKTRAPRYPAGTTMVSANFINTDTVSVLGGTLIIQDGDTNDTGSYTVDANAALVFANDRTITGSLLSAGLVMIDNAVLDLNGGLFTISNGATLTGTGTLKGNVKNNGGSLEIGGNLLATAARSEGRLLHVGLQPTIGTLIIEGNYEQLAASLLRLDLLNDGTNFTYDTLTVTGNTILGGELLMNYLPGSLTLISSNFSPLIFRGSVSNQFDKVSFTDGTLADFGLVGGVFTIQSTSLEVPNEIVVASIFDFHDVFEVIDGTIESDTEQKILTAKFDEELEENKENEENEDENVSMICT